MNVTEIFSNGSCATTLHLDRWSVVTGVALGAVAFATIFGNSLVLLAVVLNRSLRSTTTIFVSNLAVADLLLGTCVLPLSSALEVTRGCWLFGPLLCDLWASVDVMCCTASIMSLCAISMDRYVGVTRPLQRSRIVTQRRACIIVLCVWLLSCLVSVGPLIGWRKAETSSSSDGASGSDQQQQQQQQCAVSNNPWYILFSSLFSFYLPLAIVVFFYARVYRAAAKESRFLNSGVKVTRAPATASIVTLRAHRGGGGVGYRGIRGHHHDGNSCSQGASRLLAAGKLAKFRRERKAAKTLGIVVGVFIVCWLPFFFMYPFKWILCKSCDIPEMAFKIAFWLGYCNSLCNPVIYACWNRDFRRAFWNILTCRKAGRKKASATSAAAAHAAVAAAAAAASAPARSWQWQQQQHRRTLLTSTTRAGTCTSSAAVAQKVTLGQLMELQ